LQAAPVRLAMDILESTNGYEMWIGRCAPIVKHQLSDKHTKMKHDPFQFLRGTYYRWAQIWSGLCPEIAKAPSVLSVGDLHVNSFGTWRDAEGRLCWGVDDFDEAWPLPYTNDLARLAASAKIARKLGLLELRTRDACEAILTGYEQTLKAGGCPIVLAEQERQLEKLGIAALKTPKRFWEKLDDRPTVRGAIPRDARRSLERSFPRQDIEYRVVQREAGLGSLGQQRFVALAQCNGGFIAREAKRVVPSASVWLNGRVDHRQRYYGKAMKVAIRSRDPYQTITGSWLIRRLSPDSNPIKLEELPRKRDEETLLCAMGTEAANVHLGTIHNSKRLLADIHRREPDWLRAAAKKLAKVVMQEWKEYRQTA
jgi:hypothetical protein